MGTQAAYQFFWFRKHLGSIHSPFIVVFSLASDCISSPLGYSARISEQICGLMMPGRCLEPQMHPGKSVCYPVVLSCGRPAQHTTNVTAFLGHLQSTASSSTAFIRCTWKLMSSGTTEGYKVILVFVFFRLRSTEKWMWKEVISWRFFYIDQVWFKMLPYRSTLKENFIK